LIAGLLLTAGLSMVAGWVTAFRNRSYLGLLGLALLGVSGALLCASKAKEMKDMGLPAPKLVTATHGLLALAAVLGLCALVTAVQETRRRIRELQEGHRAEEEALLEIMRASAAKRKSAAEEQPTGEAGPEDRDEQR
jgi:hypothetical protein